MITNHKCGYCGNNVLHDDGRNEQGMHVKKHPAATKYHKADGTTIVEFYCGVECGFKKYEEERNAKADPTN